MKLISIILVLFVVCASLFSCTYSSVDLDKDGTTDCNLNFFDPLCVLEFDSNGGTPIQPTMASELSSPPSVTKPYHEFLGWYRDSNFEVPVIYPMKVDSNTTLYAKWLLVEYTASCSNFSLKSMDESLNSSTAYKITPSLLDLETLKKENYRVKITLEYEVYYKKDYDIAFDIGYAGAPKYSVSICYSDGYGAFENDLTTKTASQKRYLTFTTTASDLDKDQLYLRFSTKNIQNIVYFKNVSISYSCYK